MKRTPMLVAFAMSLIMAHAASAGTIVLFDGVRQTDAGIIHHQVHHTGLWSDSITWTDPNYGRATASQFTNISAGFFGGSGFSEIQDVPGSELWTSSGAAYGAFFEIDEPYLAQLNVELFETTGSALTRTTLYYRPDITTVVWDVFGTPGTTLVSREGVLVPGRYHFTLDARTNGSLSDHAAASFSGGLMLTPIGGAEVPEPATMTLFGLGLAATVWRRRKR